MGKSYDQLAPDKQQVIDAMILGSEAARITNRSHFDDERTLFIGSPDLMVNYLRGLYTLDIESRPPRYVRWTADYAEIIRDAITIQAHLPDLGAGVSHLTDLVNLLTNLPYPEIGSPEKGRSGR